MMLKLASALIAGLSSAAIWTRVFTLGPLNLFSDGALSGFMAGAVCSLVVLVLAPNLNRFVYQILTVLVSYLWFGLMLFASSGFHIPSLDELTMVLTLLGAGTVMLTLDLVPGLLLFTVSDTLMYRVMKRCSDSATGNFQVESKPIILKWAAPRRPS